MTSARDEVLMRGLVDWFGLERVHHFVSRENPGLTLSDIQEKTLELVKELADNGLVELGGLSDETHRFVAWDIPVDEAIRRIRDPYFTQFDDFAAWWFACWMSLTAYGLREAEIIEAKVQSSPRPKL